MANLAQRYPDNAAGDFYVDRTCIDCDACRRIAPAVFAEAEDHSFVHRQPQTEAGGVKPRPYGRAGAKSNRGLHTS